MLACALASIVQPFSESRDLSDFSAASDLSVTCKPTETRSRLGEAYYLAAKKRLGILKMTITSVQCFFLAGLYEMYRMRPADAWIRYSQACIRLQVILSQVDSDVHRQGSHYRVLERLYFSCTRTEL